MGGILSGGIGALIGKKFGGLGPDLAIKGVTTLLDKSGDSIVKGAEFLKILPKEEKLIPYLTEQAEAVGLSRETEALLNDPILFGTVWKEINTHDWEEFSVDSNEALDIAPWQPIIDAARNNPRYERALQAAAEYRFPKLYLLRCIALGITATDEDWLMRAKINTFRTFFLRIALPGGAYDKYINYYVILTSEKDAWDEMSQGQNSKVGFLIDSISNIASVKMGSYFEEKFEKILAERFKDIVQAVKDRA